MSQVPTFSDQPLSSEMVDQLIDTLLNGPGPASDKYVVFIDLDCGLTYLYCLANCESHDAACTAAIQAHRRAGRPETATTTCRVLGTCNESGCACGKLRERTYRLVDEVSADTDTSISSEGVQ